MKLDEIRKNYKMITLVSSSFRDVKQLAVFTKDGKIFVAHSFKEYADCEFTEPVEVTGFTKKETLKAG